MTTTWPRRSNRHLGPALVAFVAFVILLALARSVDVPRTGYGVKSDEATYAAMALSVAYDGDLAYEKRDLERFAGLYHSGPNGIFLKRGKHQRIAFGGPFPFVRRIKRDANPDRLYYGKAFIYPLLAAPLVRLYGLNGLLIFNVLLLAVAVVCAYAFLAAQSPPLSAALFTSAFFGAAALPVYGAFLMPEMFNVAIVLVAYFLWLYKEVHVDGVRLTADITYEPTPVIVAGGPVGSGVRSGLSRTFSAIAHRAGRTLTARWTDFAAAVLLGVATYSKPAPVAVLVAPLVALAWWRRQWIRGFSIGSVAVAAAASLFALNAAITGEFNYQAGDRKTFIERFPFDRPDATWQSFTQDVVDDPGQAARAVLINRQLPARFARNIEYFLVGRHFGFIPYYFPGFVAIVAWLWSRTRRDDWRIVTFFGFVLAGVGLLLVLPFTWSGGGGPPGNRYALSAYPVLLFLTPPIASLGPGLLAWLIGALFTARMLVSPFAAAKFTWELYERGMPRRLPVELPMSQDLPVALAQPMRSPIPYSDPGLRLSFLDQNAWPPEPPGMWISGSGRAEIILRAERPIRHLLVEAESPIRTTITVSLGGDEISTVLQPQKVTTFTVPAGSPVPGRYGDSAYLMTTHSSEGFVPHLVDGSPDYRNLGALLRFRAVLK
jgi:4-amino-4-deoxy-L-arabinose transferase-like glycosyltransferase